MLKCSFYVFTISGIKGVLDVGLFERPMSLEGYVFSY